MGEKEILCRKILGLDRDGVLTYNQVIEGYANALDYYSSHLDDTTLANIKVYESLHDALNYLTIDILYDYVKLDVSTYMIDDRCRENIHYKNIINNSKKIIERLSIINEDLAISLGNGFHVIANAVYDLENDDNKDKSKIYS